MLGSPRTINPEGGLLEQVMSGLRRIADEERRGWALQEGWHSVKRL